MKVQCIFLEKNQDKINWAKLSRNSSAIHLLKENQDKINWSQLSKNPSIFEIDYNFLDNRYSIYKEELIQKYYILLNYKDILMKDMI